MLRIGDMVKVDGFEDNRQHYSYLYKLGADMGEDGTVALKRALANHFGRGDGDGDIDVVVENWRAGDQKAQTDKVLLPLALR